MERDPHMDTQELIKLYQQGESLSFLSKYYNTTTYMIKQILKNNYIHIRNRSEQTRLTNMKRRQWSVNDSYFSQIDSVSKAWLIGFLAADGTIRKDSNEIKIGLSNVDKEILEKIKEELSLEKPILEYQTNNGFNCIQLTWSSFQQKQDLKKYGVVNNKTYLPMHLPNWDDDKKLAFILGYFDGDGSFTINKQGYCRFRICAHRNELLKDIQHFLNDKYRTTSSLSQDSRGLWELSYSTYSCVQMLKDMYNLNSIRLDRKYQKFLEYINQETVTSL